MSLNIEKVDYSKASNTCFAAIDTYSTYGTGSYQGWELVDLLTGEVTEVRSCNEQRNCGEGRDIHYLDRLDVLFKSAIDGTKPPKEVPFK